MRFFLASKKKQIEKEKEALEKRRFTLEKAAALANLLINTQTQVAKIEGEAALLSSNPLTAGLAPAALANITLVYGSAAIAAGLIAAQVLSYAQGTGNHPGGPAIIGEGGEHELVNLPGGRSFLSPNVATLYPNLPAGTEVIPMHDMVAASAAGVTPGQLGAIVGMAGGNTAKVEQLLEELLQVQRNQPVKEIYTGSDGWSHTSIRQGNSKIAYLKKHIYGR